MDCIFCAIAQGQIPSTKIYEDEYVLAFADISPVSFGHTLVIPKEHAGSFAQASEQSLAQVFLTAQKIAAAMPQALGCDGVNVLSNIGEAAGQTVPHFHVHLIPRYLDRNRENLTLEFGSCDQVPISELAQKLKDALA